MSLYSHNFDLLPRPAQSTFSLGNDATRLVLPDFATVAELHSFVQRLLIYRFDFSGFFVQLKIGASIICLLILVVMLIIGRRMYDNSFWIIRIMKRPSGRVLVPNAMLCFSIIEGFFGAIFVAFMWEVCNVYQFESHSLDNLLLWLTLSWCPLITGALWAAWGTYFATPTRYQSSFGIGPRSWLQRFLSLAWVVNSMGLLIPVLISISVVIPGVLANLHYSRALHRQEAWQARYANQTDFTQPMVQDAQLVWFELQRGMRIGSITFIIWSAWALFMCLSYSSIAWRLISSIRGELKKSKSIAPRFGIVATTRIFSSLEDAHEANERQRQQENAQQNVNAMLQSPLPAKTPDTMLSPYSTPNSASLMKAGQLSMHDQKTEPAAFGKEDGYGIRDARKVSIVSGTTAYGLPGGDEDDGFGAKQLDHQHAGYLQKANSSNGDGFDQPNEPAHSAAIAPDFERKTRSRTVHASEPAKNKEEPSHRRYMPNLLMQKRASVSTGKATRSQQIKELRKAFIHISIQFFAISPACIVFMCIAMMLAVTMYGSSEQPNGTGGIQFEYYLGIALLFVNWTTCLYGGITVLAIAQRTYEPVFNSVHFSAISHSGSNGDDSQANQLAGPAVGGSSSSQNSTTGNRRSLGLGRVLGRPQGSRKNSPHVNHAMSTFFETHTRQQPHSSSSAMHNGRHSNSPSSSQQELQQQESALELPHLRHDGLGREVESLDMARNGLFIERTVVVEEVADEKEEGHESSAGSQSRQSAQQHGRSGSSITRNGSMHRIGAPHMPHMPRTPRPEARPVDEESGIVSGSDDGHEYFSGGAGRRRGGSRTGQQVTHDPSSSSPPHPGLGWSY